MGVSQSRVEENAAGRRSPINNNCDSESIQRPPTSAMSSSNTTNRRLRMIIPKRRSTARKTDVSSGGETKSIHSSTPTPSPIVASFMTNISARCNPTIGGLGDGTVFNKSYPYPRAHATNLVPIGGNSVPPQADSNSGSGLRWPSSFRKRQARQRMAAALDIPSPVPSVSEPSEDTISVEEATTSISEENESRTKNQTVVQTIGSVDERQSNHPITIFVARSTNLTYDPANVITVPSPIPVTTIQPAKVDASAAKTLNLRMEKQSQPSVVISGTGIAKKTECQKSPSVVRSKSGGSGIVTTVSKYVDDPRVMESHVKRPNTLLPYKISGSRSAWAKLCVGVAPLAESECFVIENSPAFEIPPSGRGPSARNGMQHIPPSPLSSIASEKDDSGYVGGADIDEKEKRSSSGVQRNRSDGAAATASRMQSRLKNPTAYTSRQKIIYDRHAIPTTNKEQQIEVNELSSALDTSDTSISGSLVMNSSVAESDESRRDTSPVASENSKTTHSSPTTKEAKRELHDSGVKIDSICGSTSEATQGDVYGNARTTGSPGSIYRGLIDDEIRDQPDLTIGCKSPEASKHRKDKASAASQDESFDGDTIGDFGGPLRVRDKIRKRSTNNRMNESYESTVSSLSIDSEDMMLDFDGSVDLLAEEGDVVAGCDTASTYSSLGRRSSKNSGGGTGSWGRRKAKSLAAGGKRPSMEAVMDEWASLKGDVEKGPQVHRQRQRALSDLPPSSSGAPSTSSGRILKPPVTLESGGLPSMGLEQQTYRHVVQDVTVMKTLLLRLKRVLQDAETTNPFDNSSNAMNGLSKSNILDLQLQKLDDSSHLTNEALKEENFALRNQMAVMVHQLEDQKRMIQCLQHQLKQFRHRNLRRSESALDEKEIETTKPEFVEDRSFIPRSSANVVR